MVPEPFAGIIRKGQGSNEEMVCGNSRRSSFMTEKDFINKVANSKVDFLLLISLISDTLRKKLF